MAEEDYKKALLKRVSQSELREWLRRNPKPDIWGGGKYAWAYTEMPVGPVISWWRRNFEGYNTIPLKS